MKSHPALRTLTSAVLLACAAAGTTPAAAADRYWTYISGCGAADWLGRVSGSNSEGKSTCWAAGNGGASGLAAPTAQDDVYLTPAAASADVLTTFSDPARAPFSAAANTLTANGSASFAAGLAIAASHLSTTNTLLGTTGRGRIEQSGGTLQVSSTLSLGSQSGGAGVYQLSGGQLYTGTAQVGQGTGGSGSFDIGSASSTWTNSGNLFVGSYGNGTLQVHDGARVDNTGNGNIGMYAGSTGVATVSGHSSSWSNGLYLQVGTFGTGTLTVNGGAQVSSLFGDVGVFAGSTGTVNVNGAGSSWATAAELRIGDSGNGTLNIEKGGRVSSASSQIGAYAGSVGTVTVSGSASVWNSGSSLSLGAAGSGMLNILSGATVQTQALTLGSRGVLNLNGGTLQLASASKAAGGQFNWTTGTLQLADPAGATLGTGLLGSTATLASGQTLQIDRGLTLRAGQLLFLNGGALKADSLLLDGGMVAGSDGSQFNLSGIASLSGRGMVAAAVVGGAGSSITASGGTLTLGNANDSQGFDFAGRLNLGSNTVLLLDQDRAQLGSMTTLAGGARLVSVNGAHLSSGQTLIANGNAVVQGRFTNDGSVSSEAGTLSFADDVDGAGGFAGSIAFQAGFSPGNSPAALSFHGGNARFDAGSVLTIEIQGTAPGSGYDQLLDIGNLGFDGTLNLVFGSGFTADAGARLSLFGFQHFSGSFAAGRIDVSGIDRARLDFSQLAGDGSLRVLAAVPEASTVSMLLAGLAGLAFARRRSSRQQRTL